MSALEGEGRDSGCRGKENWVRLLRDQRSLMDMSAGVKSHDLGETRINRVGNLMGLFLLDSWAKGGRECIEEKVRALAHSRQNFVGSWLSHSDGGKCGGTRGP